MGRAGLLAVVLAVIAIACGGEPDSRLGGANATATPSPWLYCTTSPCQPLALLPLPTPPALGTDISQAAACDYSRPGAGDGVLLWHTDWDPQARQGICVQRNEAERLVGR